MRLSPKILILLLIGFLSQISYSQKYSVHKKKKSFIGLTGGVNFSIPIIAENYSVLSSEGSSNNKDFYKKYDKLAKNRGAQFGIRYNYSFTNSFSIVAELGYQTIGFNYFTNYSWLDTLSNQGFNREMHHLQKVSYFTLPVMARWDMSNKQLIPYVQGGIALDFRHQAKKVINYDNTIDNKETENQVSSSPIAPITNHTRKFNMGLIAGVGLSYHTKFATYGIESNFKYGLFKVIDDENRYSDLSGFALHYLDVLDQIKLSNLNIQLSISIPIDHSITLNILRRRRY